MAHSRQKGAVPMQTAFLHYADPRALADLCRALEMPETVTERLLAHLRALDPAALAPWFDGLFSLETGGASVRAIPELFKTEADPTGDAGLKALTVYLVAALHTRTLYARLGIAEDTGIYIESLKAFTRFVQEHEVTYGHYGFDRHFWIYRQLAARLFRLGALEFELYHFPADIAPAGPIAPGAPVLSVHIPSDAVMTRDALDASYRMAKAFFAEHFPDFHYVCAYCSTWLLSPVLRTLLQPDSRILLFQEDYEITQVDLTVNGGLKWVFKRHYEDFALLPEDTSLMRGMKRVLLSGEKTGSAAGYVKDFEEK